MDSRLGDDPEFPGGDQVAEAAMRGVEPLVEGGGVADAGPLAGGHHPAGVVEGRGHRLLAEDVLAGPGASLDDVGMPVVRRGDIDGLDAPVG